MATISNGSVWIGDPGARFRRRAWDDPERGVPMWRRRHSLGLETTACRLNSSGCVAGTRAASSLTVIRPTRKESAMFKPLLVTSVLALSLAAGAADAHPMRHMPLRAREARLVERVRQGIADGSLT